MSEIGYLDQIKQLIELQKVDDEIFEVRCSLDNTPKDLEDLRKRFREVEKKRNVVLDKLSHLNEQKKRLSFEIEDDSAKIKKSKNKMMNVGNAREYQAMIREMDNMEKSSRTREEERATLLEEIERQESAMTELTELHDTLRKEMEEKESTLEQTITEAQDKLKVLDHQRALAGSGIPAPIFRRYEFIRNRLDHPVIVSVKESICSGCHIAIPPQSFIELQTGHQILSCPNCQRLIYWDEHFGTPDPADETKIRQPGQDQKNDSSHKKQEGKKQEIWPEDQMQHASEPMHAEFEKGLPENFPGSLKNSGPGEPTLE